MQITLTGISDEAGASLEMQLRAHRLLRWPSLELRRVNGKDLADLTDVEFAKLEEILPRRGYNVTAVSSRIGNWERSVDDDFESEVKEFKILLNRTMRLKAPFIRVMSYNQGSAEKSKWKERVIYRLQHFCDLSAAGKIQILHENCSGWGGQSPAHSLELVELVGRNNFALLFDTGNAVIKGYGSFKWLKETFQYVKYIHIKDVNLSLKYTLPGDGAARIPECLRYLNEKDYCGPLSIEPHLFTVPHNNVWTSSSRQLRSYVHYGNRLQDLIDIIFMEGYGIIN